MTTDGRTMRRGRVLSASAIDQCRFALVRRGYDIAAVDDLLDRVASKIHRVEREVAALRLDRRRQGGELEASRQRIVELEHQLTAAQAEVDEAQQHTETTRQMFDRDLRSGAAKVHELERAIEQIREQAATKSEGLSQRLADVEHGAKSDRERAEALEQQLEEALADRQRAVTEVEARRAQIERERDEARGLVEELRQANQQRVEELRQANEQRVEELRQANEQRAADDEALGEEVARLWKLIGDLRDGLSVRQAEDSTRIETVEDQLSTLESGPLERFIRPA